jgi:phosphatidylglycerophosphatase A
MSCAVPLSIPNSPKPPNNLMEDRIAQDPLANRTDASEAGAVIDERPPRTKWAWAVGTFIGIGFWRPGSGTWASLITLGLWWLLAHFLVPASWQWLVVTVIVWMVIIVGIPASSIVEIESGRKDPGHVVVDEVAGQLIALIAVPLRWKYLILSFILFRVFDIVKPPPLRRLEKLEGGAGIVLDDVGAGVYALVLVHLLVRFHVL